MIWDGEIQDCHAPEALYELVSIMSWHLLRPLEVMQMARPQLVWISKGLGGVNQRKQRRLYAYSSAS